jgi:hypothetical protein
MIEPQSIFVATLSHSHQYEGLCMHGLVSCALAGRFTGEVFQENGHSDVQCARVRIARKFLESDCDWLMLVDADIGFRVIEWDLLWEDRGELAVCAEYVKKDPRRYSRAHFGCGFMRVHRSVFETIKSWTWDDGRPLLQQATYDGELYDWYFPAGINVRGEYKGEDHGFWTLVSIVQVPARVETRANLIHVGKGFYAYEPGRADDAGAIGAEPAT